MKKDYIKNIELKGSFYKTKTDALRVLPINIEYYLSGITTVAQNDGYGRHISFEIVGHDYALKNQKTVGYIYGRFFDCIQMSINKINPKNVFYNVDQYTWELYESIIDDKNAISSKKNIFMIDSIFIKKEYRGAKIGSTAIIMLEEMLKADFNREIGVFAIDSEPRWGANEKDPSESEYDDMVQNVLKFWKQLGFQPVKGAYSHKYMYFNTNLNMREIYGQSN